MKLIIYTRLLLLICIIINSVIHELNFFLLHLLQ